MPKLDHVNIQARDGKAMVAFLETVLGATEGFRPPFSRPGHWLYLDGVPAIHVDTPDRPVDFPQGIFNHIAFGIYELGPVLGRVKSTGYPFEMAGIPGGVGQIFVIGPEGVKIEIQYHR